MTISSATAQPTEPVGPRTDVAESYVWVREATLTALLVVVGVLLWLWFASYATEHDRLWPGWGIPLALLALTGLCFAVRRRSYYLAASLLTVGLFGGAVAFLLLPGERLAAPFVFVAVVVVGGALHGARTALVIAGAAALVILASRPLAGVVVAPEIAASALLLVVLTGIASWATTRSLYATLHWAWASAQQAADHLQQVRRYQGELVGALQQLERANYQLERANHALAWARAEAEEARRLKAQFAAHVSHELRTPINLIVGFGELMVDHPEVYDGARLPGAYLADLTAVQRSAKHLQGLINDILDLSQIDVGGLPVV